MKSLLKSIGPAIIVAAVVLGPGSILTSSKVGASFGIAALPVIFGAAFLMIGMVALSARLGSVYELSLCQELATRLGRPIAIAIGLILFTLIALFQSSNNIALVGGLEPLLGHGDFSFPIRCIILLAANLFAMGCLALARDLYRSIERLMKVLIGLMSLAFLANFAIAFLAPKTEGPIADSSQSDWLALLAMVGTTFSVAGAFYQAYLVRERGWSIGQLRQGLLDSVVSITTLGIVTAVILLTSWRVFYGNPMAGSLNSVGDVARQLEPLFGPSARIIFSAGILAGALSSFLINAIIGGTVLSDALGQGSKLSEKGPIRFSLLALFVGLIVAIASFARQGSVVPLITFAQALTVLGIPALAAALIYLGSRKELVAERRTPRWMLIVAFIGLIVSCILAALTARKVYDKIAFGETTNVETLPVARTPEALFSPSPQQSPKTV